MLEHWNEQRFEGIGKVIDEDQLYLIDNEY